MTIETNGNTREEEENGESHHNKNKENNGCSILKLSKDDSDAAIQRFQRFLQFETVSATGPDTGAYVNCAKWLVEQLTTTLQGLTVEYLPEAPKHSPVVVACWKGTNPELPVILLNSHYDVVPADTSKWTVPPFEGLIENGKIYGRGTQDMKCVCMQYIEAIRQIQLLKPTFQPTRSIYLTFVPDEEIGGSGMAAFLSSDLYKNQIQKDSGGVALALDEGLASTTNTFDVFYGERLPWWVDVKATGPTGHGSRFLDHTAVEQLLAVTEKALKFRQGQRDILEMKHDEHCTHAVVAANKMKKRKLLGDVTSLNITRLQAGVPTGNTYALNCVPPEALCTFDIRISPHMEPKDMKDLLDTWCQECSQVPGAVTWSHLEELDGAAMNHATTDTDKKVNPWYGVFCDTMEQTLGCSIEPQVFPAATDSRFLRALGIRALGFSPMRNTEILLHENDEYILESNYLEGIGVYYELIQALSSQGDEMERRVHKKRPADDDNDEANDDTKTTTTTKAEKKVRSREIMILFGPPGAGKGTHGPKIENLLSIPQLSTGDMLRAAVSAGTEVGKKASAIMQAGGLVSDEIVIEIVRGRIQEDDCKLGFILDGFPRTVEQAKALDRMLAEEDACVTKIIELQVPDSVLEERITGRWIHKQSGRSYHVKYAPPKSMNLDADGKPTPESMTDDDTGDPLMQRGDDTSSALVKRLQSYHDETLPILNHYRPNGIVHVVNANQNMDAVWSEVLAALQGKE